MSVASSSDVSSGVNHDRSEEKGEEVGEVAHGDPRLLLSTRTHALSIPGDQALPLSATWLRDRRDKKRFL